MPKSIAQRRIIFVLITGIIYLLSNPNPRYYYDYTYRVAVSLLNGAIGIDQIPPGYLNEFVPFEGSWYSVFPLGSVLTMLPAGALKAAGVIDGMPARALVVVTATAACWLILKIGSRYDLPDSRVLMNASGLLFGTWMWANLTYGGAWQLALGFAVVGELGAIFFTVYDRRPFLAGIFFALSFGNRTEVLLTAPIFLILLYRSPRGSNRSVADSTTNGLSSAFSTFVKSTSRFCAVPFLLGVSTLAYNFARFHSVFDFGYARIPGILSEPWYEYGIFSYHYIWRQAWEMLFRPWESIDSFPFLIPNGFSSSILISSPFLLFLLRPGCKDRLLKYSAWAAIVLMTMLFWLHGNSGGWQFGYRYAMVLLPWAFVILLENSLDRPSRLEWATYFYSIGANAYAVWLFHWTNYIKPY